MAAVIRVAGHVGQLLVHELRGIGAALADEAGVEPLLGDALELAEEVELRLLAGIAPLGVEQPLGEVEDERGRPHVAEVLEVQVHALADDAGVARDRWADEVGREFQDGVVVEVGGQPLLGQLHAVALDAREADFERIALGAHGLDLDRLARRLRRGDDRLGGEVERNAEHVGVFDVEQALLVQVVGLAAQRAADHLLAQELGAEGADAEHVGDGVGVPAFGEHRDRDDAADGAAELAGLADGVHDLAQQFLVGDVLAGTRVAGALDDLAAEALDLVGGHAAEVVVERVAGFELLAVDQQRVRARQRVAGGLVEVAEQREAAVLQRGRAVLVLAMKAGDVVVDQLRDRGVLADDDEAGRHA